MVLATKELQYEELATQESDRLTALIQALPGFPYSVWEQNRTRYKELYNWFSGAQLDVNQDQGGLSVPKYPIQLNPIRGACYKHAYALFGEVGNDSRPLAVPRLHPDVSENRGICQRADEYLYKAWWESSGRSIMLRNGLLSQIFGGCIFRMKKVPKNMRLFHEMPVQVEIVHPINFVGITYSGEEYLLQEAWTIKLISAYEARKLGMTSIHEKDENAWYVEYWTPEDVKVTINGVDIPHPSGGTYSGENPFGFVPTVYIPHIRATSFYGEPLITDNITGIVKEINTREADKGDASSQDSHKDYVAVDVQGKIESDRLPNGSRVYGIKSAPSIGGGQLQADLKELTSQRSSEPMRLLTQDLYQHFRREAFIPAVADGEDEGSQRSGETLLMRMWPLTSHTNMERTFWTDGLAVLNNMLLRAISEDEDIPNFPKKTTRYRIETRWAPILPKDREAFINELVNRASAHLGSLHTLLSQLDDIEDPDDEIKEIKSFISWMAKETAKNQPKTPPAGSNTAQNNQNQNQQKQKGDKNNG
jgi:hypothetical protein